MQQVLKQLKELQRLDSSLSELSSLRGDLPQQVETLQKEQEEKERQLRELEETLVTLNKEQAAVEVEIKDLEEKLKKYQDQLYSVKSNREYDAVTMEIEGVKIKTGEKETRLLELIDLIKSRKEEIQDRREAVETTGKHLIERREELKKKMAETEKDELYLQDQAGKIRHRLKKEAPRYLSSYDRIFKAKNGQAVVPVVRRSCGGCYKALPPQKVLEIRQMDSMQLCEVCGRILVWDEKESESGT